MLRWERYLAICRDSPQALWSAVGAANVQKPYMTLGI
jgi:hypothetical protein